MSHSTNVLAVTEENFDTMVLKSQKPVLVDFWAEWCGPCRAMGPVIDKIATEYDGKVVVGKCNIEESIELAKKYNIRSIPALILFEKGSVKASHIGLMTQNDLSNLIDSNI